MILVDHKLSKSSLHSNISYIFASDFLTWCLLRRYFQQMLDQFVISCYIIFEDFVSIDEDNDPLLDDVGIEGVLLIMEKCLENFVEGADSYLSMLILNIDHFFKKKEELSVSFRLEFLQAIEDEVYN